MIKLFIPGEPATVTSQQKGALARGRRVFHYTKSAVKAEKRRIGKFVSLQRPATPLDGFIELEILFVSPLTQAQAKRHVAELSNPLFVLRKGTAPDWDNWAKLLCDALSDERFWTNDARITDGTCRKRYGSEPRIEVTIREVAEIP